MFHLRPITFHFLLSLAILAIAPFALSSCSDDEPTVSPNDNGSKVKLTMLINVGSESTSAATTTEDLTNPNGTFYENYIDTSKLRIFIYKPGNNVNGYDWNLHKELTITGATRISNTTYRVTCEYEDGILPTTSKFYVAVTANWPYKPTDTSAIAYLCVKPGSEYQYHYGSESHYVQYDYFNNNATPQSSGTVDYRDADGNDTYFTPSETTPIPMFGVKGYNYSDYEGKTEVDLGSIYMIRAMAKLIINYESTDADIVSAKLRYSYDTGLCGFTHSYNDSRTDSIDSSNRYIVAIPGVWTTGYAQGYNNENPLKVIENVPFKKVSKGTSSKSQYVLYIPAYNNATGFEHIKTYQSYISIYTKDIPSLSGDEYDDEFKVQFENEDGSVYNLCRNYMYIYNITVLKKSIKYSVIKWDYRDAAPIVFE
jgi:hypothetical protein